MQGIVEKIKREQHGKATREDAAQLLEMYGNLTPELKERADKYGYLYGLEIIDNELKARASVKEPKEVNPYTYPFSSYRLWQYEHDKSADQISSTPEPQEKEVEDKSKNIVGNIVLAIGLMCTFLVEYLLGLDIIELTVGIVALSGAMIRRKSSVNIITPTPEITPTPPVPTAVAVPSSSVSSSPTEMQAPAETNPEAPADKPGIDEQNTMSFKRFFLLMIEGIMIVLFFRYFATLGKT
jgi:hypothetical protein